MYIFPKDQKGKKESPNKRRRVAENYKSRRPLCIRSRALTQHLRLFFTLGLWNAWRCAWIHQPPAIKTGWNAEAYPANATGKKKKRAPWSRITERVIWKTACCIQLSLDENSSGKVTIPLTKSHARSYYPNLPSARSLYGNRDQAGIIKRPTPIANCSRHLLPIGAPGGNRKTFLSFMPNCLIFNPYTTTLLKAIGPNYGKRRQWHSAFRTRRCR